MKQEETLAKWQEFCPYNQVKYGEDVALITGFEQAGKYPITVIKSNGTAECYDVKGTDLVPIGLDDAGKILKKLQPNKVTPFECVFSDKDEQNKVCMTFCNNFCSVIKNGEEIYDIEATIYCLRNSHKGIIIGKNGEMLKRIGRLARIDMEENFGVKVNLKTWVKVKEDWQDNNSIVNKFKLQ